MVQIKIDVLEMYILILENIKVIEEVIEIYIGVWRGEQLDIGKIGE